MIVGILLVQAVAFAILSAIVASNKNRSPLGWGALGFLFGLFAFIAAIAVGKVEKDTRSSRRQSVGKKRNSPTKKQPLSTERRQQSTAQDFDPDDHEKKCPDCAEYIKLEARVCKHCGHRFSDGEVERQIEKRRSQIEDGQQAGQEWEKEEVKTENLSKGMRYILNTHDFGEDSDECEKCGVSKSYVVKHQYKCRRSKRN